MLFATLCVISSFVVIRAEVFTAMNDMEALLTTERHVVTVIDEYIKTEMARLERLKEFAKDYEIRNRDALRDGSNYLANPVNAFLIVKRLTADWNYVESLMRQNAAETFLQNITTQRDTALVKFPEPEDLTGAAAALLRLQDTYQLSTHEIAEGRIQGVKRADDMTAHDCFELGRVAYNNGDYYHTLLWMQEAYERLKAENPPTVHLPEILEYLAYSMYQQGNLKRALQLTEELVEADPMHPRAAGNVKFYEEAMAKDGFKKGDDGDLPPVTNVRKDDGGVPEREVYEALCRGEYELPIANQSKLYCYYKRNRPFLKLAPFKVELVHLKPKIAIFRNVITDEEIKLVKEFATPRLQRATVQNSQTGELETASYRISKSGWIKPTEHPAFQRMNERIELMTDLSMDTAEDLQVANYGIGGHYDPHFDFARKEEKNAFKGLNTGNRVATVLFYMSQPDAGGATAFPDLRISLWPTMYDAVFWFNLLKNGEGDLTTRHAGCPVLAGSKWVMNRWLHEYGQEFTRPCALDQWDYE